MATYTTMEGPHHIAIRELDLRTCHPSTMADRVGAVPVLKTSAGEFPFSLLLLLLHFFPFLPFLVSAVVGPLSSGARVFSLVSVPCHFVTSATTTKSTPVMSFMVIVMVNLDDELKR